jgi:hypothetical protein
MRYCVRVTDGHCFRDIEIETDKGVEEACSRAMKRASEIERTGEVGCRGSFESSGRAEYVDSVSSEDSLLDVPVEYRCWTERDLLQEIAELKAEIKRLQNVRPTG